MTTEAPAFRESDELPPDTVLLGGRLVIDVRIGQGGAATVYAGTMDDGRDVAVKILSADYAELPTSRQRFRNEVMLAQHLAGHPGVVVPYEMGELPELGGRPYMTMPLVKGRSLLLLLGRLPVADAVMLMRDLARILAGVHARGIVHRDVKPGNVIVGERDGVRTPCLLDFGLAYSSGEGSAPTTEGVTTVHELPGTKHYMAPEQVLGAKPDPRCDVYALGVTMVEVLSGFLPLGELSPADAARRKCDPSLPSLSIAGRVPGLPRELERVIDATLEREPERRTPSAALVAEQLGGVLEGLRGRSQPRVVAVAPEVSTVPELAQAQANPPQVAVAGQYEQQAQTDRQPEASPVLDAERPAMPPSSVGSPVVEARHREQGRASNRRVPLVVAAAVVAVVGLGAAFLLTGGPTEGSASEDGTVPAASSIAASGAGLGEVGSAADTANEAGDAAGADAVEPGPAVASEPAVAPEPTEPSAVEEPAPQVEPEPEPPRKSSKPRKDKPRVPGPGPEVDESPCTDVAAEATMAVRSKQWSRVLKLTKSSRCWDDDVTRNSLRINALFELARYDECVKLGETIAHPEVRRWAKRCEQQLAGKGA
jgi:serine/threonine protein kinase